MKLQRLNTPEGRFYYPVQPGAMHPSLDSLILLPSVSTVLKQIPSLRLEEIRLAIGDDELQRIGEAATKRGTVMHAFLENYFICKKANKSDENCLLYTQKKTVLDLQAENYEEKSINKGRELFYNFYHEGYLQRVSKVLCTEQFVWSLIHKFAGTLDFAYINNIYQNIITDFKSASSERDEETIHKYILQLASYALGFEERFNTKVHHVELWISSPDGIQDRSIGGTELEEKKEEYIHWANAYNKTFNPRDIFLKYYQQ